VWTSIPTGSDRRASKLVSAWRNPHGTDLSRVFIHLVETGKSRPSRRVLALIARRTEKPTSYFLAGRTQDSPETELANGLRHAASQLRSYIDRTALSATPKGCP
jgi:transcriptional regulator with XRE-family HTH domain